MISKLMFIDSFMCSSYDRQIQVLTHLRINIIHLVTIANLQYKHIDYKGINNIHIK